MGFYGDGSFAYVMNVHHANGRYQEFKDTGRWSIAGNQLAFETSKGVDYCDFELREDQLFIYFPHLKMTVDFVPMQ